MKNLINKRARGFTIIEVLIVLAIAGLILSIVFIAVPQLERNARDNKRQSIADRLSTELQAYASNNQGTFPFTDASGSYTGTNCASGGATPPQFTCADWFSRYIAGGKVNITDPKTGSAAEVYLTTDNSDPLAGSWLASRVLIGAGLKCKGEGFDHSVSGSANAKSFAILIGLERSNTWYCIDNG